MRARITLFIIAVAAACAVSGCSSAQTSVTAPTGPKCELSATSTPSSFTASGGSATVSVSAARECPWTITTDSSWVSITGDRAGQGSAQVPYSVAANPAASPRSGAIVIGAERVQLSQAAAPCRFSLSRTGDSIGAPGGRLSVDVSTLAGCTWTAASGAGWIAIASGQSGSASGTVGLSIAANGGGRRVGQVNVAGQNYTVTQDAAPAPPPPPPPTPPPAPTPTPSPPPATHVHFVGIVTGGVSGRCPQISFFVSGASVVVTDKSTEFRKGDCGDVHNGSVVEIDGVLQANLTVKANSVQLNN
jgi:BACON domain-containing protein/uncharacterized protein DUF5666/all-beta uncharacterized protein